MINWSRPLPAPASTFPSGPISRRFKFDPRSPSVLTESVRSYLTGNLNSVIAHRLSGEDGVFLGVMTRRIDPANYEKFFASVALGTGAAISMFHADGTLLARYPHVDELIGQNFAKAPLLQRVRDRGRPADAARAKPDRPDRTGWDPQPRSATTRASWSRPTRLPPRSPTGASKPGSWSSRQRWLRR